MTGIPTAAVDPAAAAPIAHRGRLFRKYLQLIIALAAQHRLPAMYEWGGRSSSNGSST